MRSPTRLPAKPTTQPDEIDWCTVAEAARRLNLTEGAVRYRIKKGHLANRKQGRVVLVAVPAPPTPTAANVLGIPGAQWIKLPPPGQITANVIASIIFLAITSLVVWIIREVSQASFSYRYLLVLGYFGALTGLLITSIAQRVDRSKLDNRVQFFVVIVVTYFIVTYMIAAVQTIDGLMGPEEIGTRDGVAATLSTVVSLVCLKLVFVLVRKAWKY